MTGGQCPGASNKAFGLSGPARRSEPTGKRVARCWPFNSPGTGHSGQQRSAHPTVDTLSVHGHLCPELRGARAAAAAGAAGAALPTYSGYPGSRPQEFRPTGLRRFTRLTRLDTVCTDLEF